MGVVLRSGMTILFVLLQPDKKNKKRVNGNNNLFMRKR